MISTQVNAFNKTLSKLTQAVQTRATDTLPVGHMAMPVIFTRTFMSSTSGDLLLEVGAGKLDANGHTRLLMQHAYDTDTPLAEVNEQYVKLLTLLGYQKELFRKVIAPIMGAADKPLRENSIAPVTPTFIFSKLSPALEKDVPDFLTHLMTDFICHMLAPLGLIVRDAPYIYCMKRYGLFPRYQNFVDIVEASQIQHTLQCLADADLSLVKDMMDRKRSLLPGMVAEYLTNAIVTALDIARGSYDAEAVVRSSLTTLGRIWDAQAPKEIQPRERIVKHPVISELRSNLAVFLAYQDMVGIHGLAACEISYNDEEMASVILPLFSRALSELSPFPVRMIEDVVAHIGKRSTRTHTGVPGHVIVYEDWDFGIETPSFTRVKQTSTGNQVFLIPSPTTTGKLTDSMRPIKNLMDMTTLVHRRLATYEMNPASLRVPKAGTELILAFPSLIELEGALGEASGTIASEIKGVAMAVKNRKYVDNVLYDYFAMITHLAVVKAPSTRVSFAENATGHVPYLVWSVSTALSEPVGPSAIEQGRVETSEPLEVLVYVDDFAPAMKRTARVLPIDDYKHGVHLWDWYGSSHQLEMNPGYQVTIRNKSYLVEVNEAELLGLGQQKKNVRFLKPTMAAAIVSVWITWLMEDKAFIDAAEKGTSDTLVIEGFKGRQIQSAMQLMSLLIAIGAHGAGANASKTVRRKIADMMYSQSRIDDYSELLVGIQAHRINVWAGLVTLQLLGLITTEDATNMMVYLVENNAMALVIGTVDLPLLS